MPSVFILILIASLSYAEEPESCGQKIGLSALGVFQRSALKVQLFQKMSDEGIGEFCDKDAEKDVVDSLKADGSSGDLTYQQAWFKAQTPNEELRKSTVVKFGFDKHGKELTDSNPNEKLSIKKSYLQEKSADKDKFGISATNTDKNKAYACKLLTLRYADDCKKGLDQIVKIMNVTDTGHSLRQVQWDIVENQKFKEPLLKAAKFIQDKVKTQKVDGDIFSDLTSNFEHSGLSKQEARDLTWKMMGIWGSAGSNLSTRLEASGVESYEPKVSNAIESILSSIPYLDSLAKKKGTRYALPRGIKAKCDQGKSYHFWMSAFLTRELVKTGLPPDASTAATFTAQKAYQMLSKTSGRDPTNILIRDEYDPSINRMRIDLSYAAAGSYFGAADAQAKIYNADVDKILRHTFKASARSPRLEKADAEALIQNDPQTAYRYFMMTLSPDTAYRSLAP